LTHLEVSPDADPERFRDALESTVGAVFQDGHDVKALRNGDEIFPAMLAAVEAAESRGYH